MNSSPLPTHTKKPPFIARKIMHGDYYFLDLEANRQATPTIACGGLEHCALDYNLDRHSFAYYGIEYIVGGQCRLTLNGRESTLSPGSLFSYTPHCHHKITNTGDTPLVKYFVDFAGQGADDILRSDIFKNPKAYNPGQSAWIAHTFQEFQECGTADNPQTQKICRHLLNYLIARLDSIQEKDDTQVSQPYSTFESSKSYIKSNYTHIHVAHEVADMFHISPQYLCRLFRRYCDETPSQMLMRLKLTRSAALLEKGDLLVKEVAEKVGFDDQYYFSKRFKGYYGLSPRNYANAPRIPLSA